MSKTIGSYVAKTNLPSILEQVAKGNTFTITKRGKPIAILSPIQEENNESLVETIRSIKELRKSFKLRPLSLKKLVSNGRD
jgi:prevent-host-death family protein